MYLFDPQMGRRRRALARDKAVSLTHEAQDAARVVARDASNRARGLAAGDLSVLVGGKRATELLAVERVLARPMPAELRRADCAPCNAGARHVEAAEGTAQALRLRQHVLFRHEDVLEHDLAGDRGAQ